MTRYALVGKSIILSVILLLGVVLAGPTLNALTKETAPPPGEVLDVQDEATTAIKLPGTFAVEVSSTGVGTIKIYRSESGSANWLVVKTLTNTSAGDQRKYLYEYFGDDGRGGGAWYKAVVTTLSSGSYRIRFVK